MTAVWERVITSEPVDLLARLVTASSRVPERYEVCARGWEPGAFSRVPVPCAEDRMTGKRSGRLVVLGKRAERVRSGWPLVARCNCGNYVILRHRHIRHQSVRMCGECEAVRKMCGAAQPERVYKGRAG